MEKFECRCIDNFSHIMLGDYGTFLANLKKNKYYTCEYLYTSKNLKINNNYKIRVYDSHRFIYFVDEEHFSKYFDHNQYLRKKKLQKLNLAISNKK